MSDHSEKPGHCAGCATEIAALREQLEQAENRLEGTDGALARHIRESRAEPPVAELPPAVPFTPSSRNYCPYVPCGACGHVLPGDHVWNFCPWCGVRFARCGGHVPATPAAPQPEEEQAP